MSASRSCIAIVNAGAATLKIALIEADSNDLRERQRIERDWSDTCDVAEAVMAAVAGLEQAPDAFGFRVVHGGADLVRPTRITAAVEAELERLVSLAPLHNLPALRAIRAVREAHPRCPAVAVFDTAFHAERPVESLAYALPRDIVEAYGLRRYGFHGIAHAALAGAVAEHRGAPDDTVAAVTLQLGAGCSACAIRNGRSIETSMGYTPLEGLVMATRSGDVDPAVVIRLARGGYTIDRIEHELTRRSGLLGLAGSADMRAVLAAEARGEPAAIAAVRLFCHRLVLTVGAYLTLLDGTGALVFGGGIGASAPSIRARVANGLGAWNVRLDRERNESNAPGLISQPGSREVFVFRTDEERLIAREVLRCLA